LSEGCISGCLIVVSLVVWGLYLWLSDSCISGCLSGLYLWLSESCIPGWDRLHFW